MFDMTITLLMGCGSSFLPPGDYAVIQASNCESRPQTPNVSLYASLCVFISRHSEYAQLHARKCLGAPVLNGRSRQKKMRVNRLTGGFMLKIMREDTGRYFRFHVTKNIYRKEGRRKAKWPRMLILEALQESARSSRWGLGEKNQVLWKKRIRCVFPSLENCLFNCLVPHLEV